MGNIISPEKESKTFRLRKVMRRLDAHRNQLSTRLGRLTRELDALEKRLKAAVGRKESGVHEIASFNACTHVSLFMRFFAFICSRVAFTKRQ